MKVEVNFARELISKFFAGYPSLAKVKKEVEAFAMKNFYTTTLYGRKRFFEKKTMFSDSKEMEKYFKRIKREGFNHVIQGTGADITKLALVELYRKNPFGDKFRIILQIHDEIVAEAHESIAVEAWKFMKDTMTEVEQRFLGDIPALAGSDTPEKDISNYWKK